MPSKSKQKGNRFEYLIRDMTEDIGLNCQRAWGSSGKSLGMHEEVDLLIEGKIKVQAKCRKKLPNYIIPNENVDIQVIKEDRGTPYAVIPYDDWLELTMALKNVTTMLCLKCQDPLNSTGHVT